MKKSVACAISLICLLSGIILGFLFSPVKHGIDVGNNSGNNSGNNYHTGKKDEI
jgi:hypothetical protein